ncbi:MAG TPA: LysM peptidoglycan-binding domain-containing protein [Acidimicrobiales bacterium]|nr:LysM peptidoglycan-binding domain-containing protein [Acidimicrobiales bacterium]
MSVACELEYESIYPGLRVVSGGERRVPALSRTLVRRLVLGAVALGLLVLLMLPLRALGGSTLAASAPTAGQEYIVQPGDTLTSIAAQVGGGNVDAMAHRLAAETGSTTIVPGEHLLIP